MRLSLNWSLKSVYPLYSSASTFSCFHITLHNFNAMIWIDMWPVIARNQTLNIYAKQEILLNISNSICFDALLYANINNCCNLCNVTRPRVVRKMKLKLEVASLLRVTLKIFTNKRINFTLIADLHSTSRREGCRDRTWKWKYLVMFLKTNVYFIEIDDIVWEHQTQSQSFKHGAKRSIAS